MTGCVRHHTQFSANKTGSPAAQVNVSLHSLGLARNSKLFVYLQPGAQAQSNLSQPWSASANPSPEQQFPDYAEGDGSLVLSIRRPGANRDRVQPSRPISSGQWLWRRHFRRPPWRLHDAPGLWRHSARSSAGRTRAHHGECSSETRMGAEGRGVALCAVGSSELAERLQTDSGDSGAPFPSPQPNRSVKGDHHVRVCSGVKWKGLRRILTEFICSLGWFCVRFHVLSVHLFVEVGPMGK